MKTKSITIWVMVSILMTTASIVDGFEVFPICTNPAEQVFPAVSKNTIIWSDYRSGKWQIYGYDLSTKREFSIPSSSPMTGYSDDRAIAIDGDTIVWMDDRSGGRGIYGYNLSTWTEFLISSGNKYFPEIDDDIVVWENGSVSGYNLSTGHAFYVGSGVVPAISGDIVVSHVTGNHRDIAGYDLSTDTRFIICDDGGNQCNPDISGNIVVWRDDRDGSFNIWDIWGYDLSTKSKFLIKDDTGGSTNYPIIDGDIVVWDGGGYDLRTGNELILPIGLHPYVSGDIIVWEQNGDIYGVIIPEPATLLLLGLGAVMVRKNAKNASLKLDCLWRELGG